MAIATDGITKTVSSITTLMSVRRSHVSPNAAIDGALIVSVVIDSSMSMDSPCNNTIGIHVMAGNIYKNIHTSKMLRIVCPFPRQSKTLNIFSAYAVDRSVWEETQIY